MTTEAQTYATRCVGELYAYAEKSTRFGAGSLSVRSANAVLRHVVVVAQHALEVRGEWQERPGTLRGNPGDFVTRNEAEHERAMDAQASEEVRRPQTAQDLVARLQASGYPGLAERTRFRTHPRALLYQHTCDRCSGRGRITCSRCNGRGNISCSPCYGRGKVSCSSCGGRGSTTQYYTESVNGQSRTATRESTCFQCSFGQVNCRYCSGSGRSTCGACGGEGTVECSDCAGHGALTRVGHVHTWVTPHFSLAQQGEPPYVASTLARLELPNLAKVAQVVTRQLSVAYGDTSVSGTYDAAIWYCEVALLANGRDAPCLMFGTPPILAEAGGYLEAVLESDIEPLRLARLPLVGGRTIKNFMASEIHQHIVESEANGHDAEYIANYFRNVVSARYVGRALAALRGAVRAKLLWNELGWVSILALLSVTITPILAALDTWPQPRSTHLIEVPASQAGSLTLCALPVMVVFGYLAAKLTNFRVRRLGGETLRVWAVRKRLLRNTRTALLGGAAGALAIFGIFTNWPLWVDREGYAYGIAQVAWRDRNDAKFEAAMAAAPAEAEPPRRATATARSQPRAAPVRPKKRTAAAPSAHGASDAGANPTPSAKR